MTLNFFERAPSDVLYILNYYFGLIEGVEIYLRRLEVKTFSKKCPKPLSQTKIAMEMGEVLGTFW